MREMVLQGGDKWNERSPGMRVVVGIWEILGFIHPFLPFGWDLTHDSRIEARDPELAI